MAGAFITFEGGEGAGKTTQIKAVAAALQKRGRETVVTREPGGTKGAEEIRELLISGASDRWTDLTECLLMNAARTEHVAHVILPALAANKVVLCDRFSDSTRAYQSGAGQLEEADVLAIEAIVTKDARPDLTIIFDLPVETGMARASKRGAADRFEKKGTAYHESVRASFLNIADTDPNRCAVVDASQSADGVTDQILKLLHDRLKIG